MPAVPRLAMAKDKASQGKETQLVLFLRLLDSDNRILSLLTPSSS